MPAGDRRTLKLGVTLHSFAAEFRSYTWSFDDLMYNASQLGGGVEIVGPTLHRGFPRVPEEFVTAFRSAVERHGLTPVAYGSYSDPFMYADRELSDDEMVAYMLPQIEGAARLGIPIIRAQHFAAETVERLLPTAERLGVTLGYELHVPLDIGSDRTQFLLEQIERLDSPHLGLIPDTGIFTTAITPARLRAGLDIGLSQEQVDEVVSLWTARAGYQEAEDLVKSYGIGQVVIEWVERIWGAFGHSTPSELADILPHVVHIHGKFYALENGTMPEIPYRELVFTLLENDYQGWIASEFQPYFGFSTEYKQEPVDAFQSVAEQQRAIRHYIDQYSRDGGAG